MASFIDRQIDAAIAHHRAGRLAEAEAAYRKVLAQAPRHPDALHFLGLLLHQVRRDGEGIALMRQSIALRPRAAAFHFNLANALREQKHHDEALLLLQQALALDPRLGDAWIELGSILRTQGRLDEALQALARAKNAGVEGAYSNLLYTMWLHPAFTPAQIFNEHRRWAAACADPLRPSAPVFANTPEPDRRLRIGYVSQDFWRHVLGRFIQPILAQHNREGFEIFCYSDTRHDDDISAAIRAQADHWRPTLGLSADALASQVRADRIDILVDLAAHSGVNRLAVFARKPAPVQVTYLGYPATTGMAAMDYRITDRHLDPPGMTDSLHSESLIRLPEAYWAFPTPNAAPGVNPLPALARGFVTFAAYNALAKMNPPLMALWARILARVPGSRLRVLVPGGVEHNAHVPAWFSASGIPTDRLDLCPSWAYQRYLAEYNECDLALDTLPYNGGATSLDSLYMGVPFVTVAGDSAVSRAGLMLLRNVGLDDLVATSHDEYVEKAITLAADLPRLAALRLALRDRLAASALCSTPGLTAHLEHAYRLAWRRWCAGEPPISMQL